jgi:transposase
VIEPLLSKKESKRGRPRADERKTLNGIVYVLKTGCAWADMPSAYGSPVTCWRRLKRWSDDGTWERVWQVILGKLHAQGELNWDYTFVDTSYVPAKKGAIKSA